MVPNDGAQNMTLLDSHALRGSTNPLEEADWLSLLILRWQRQRMRKKARDPKSSHTSFALFRAHKTSATRRSVDRHRSSELHSVIESNRGLWSTSQEYTVPYHEEWSRYTRGTRWSITRPPFRSAVAAPLIPFDSSSLRMILRRGRPCRLTWSSRRAHSKSDSGAIRDPGDGGGTRSNDAIWTRLQMSSRVTARGSRQMRSLAGGASLP